MRERDGCVYWTFATVKVNVVFIGCCGRVKAWMLL